ncbi:MAG: hypothetical protein L0338_14650, partial [Acidobacteria bacterium]|nr:hypothetical protein [Acidobacteriota bacterium]
VRIPPRNPLPVEEDVLSMNVPRQVGFQEDLGAGSFQPVPVERPASTDGCPEVRVGPWVGVYALRSKRYKIQQRETVDISKHHCKHNKPFCIPYLAPFLVAHALSAFEYPPHAQTNESQVSNQECWG